MQAITITDSRGVSVRPSDLTALPIVAASDVEAPVHTLARDARPVLQKLCRNASNVPFVMGLKVPETLQPFVAGVLGRTGLSIEFKSTPDNHTPFVCVTREDLTPASVPPRRFPDAWCTL